MQKGPKRHRDFDGDDPEEEEEYSKERVDRNCPACGRAITMVFRETGCPHCNGIFCLRDDCLLAHQGADAAGHACCTATATRCIHCNTLHCNGICFPAHQGADSAGHACCASSSIVCTHCSLRFCRALCAGGHAELDGSCGHKTCQATRKTCVVDTCKKTYCRACSTDPGKFVLNLCKTCLDTTTEETVGTFKVKHQRVPGSENAEKRQVSVIGGVAARAVGKRKTPPPPLSSGKTEATEEINELKQYDRGHLVALELAGLDDHRLIAPMIRQLNQSGKWRKMETSIGDLLSGRSLKDVKNKVVSHDTSVSRTDVGLTLGIPNVIDARGWEVEVYLFYEDRLGDPRVPVWFYVRLFHNQKLWTHFSLGNRCGKKATMPDEEEALEFQAAKDIYTDLASGKRATLVRDEVRALYCDAVHPPTRPNQLLEFMHDVNFRCKVLEEAKAAEREEEEMEEEIDVVFKKFQLETEGPSRSYSDFQREILRKFNRWKNDGKLMSDMQTDGLYEGEMRDIYLELDECGGRSAPEVDHIDPSYQGGGNYYINGRLVSFLHNHLYREKKTIGSQPVSDLLREAFLDGRLAFSSRSRQARFCHNRTPFTNPMAYAGMRAIWISSDDVVSGSLTEQAFLDAHFRDDVLFEDAESNRALKVRGSDRPYNGSHWQHVGDRQTFLKAGDERERKYKRERDLESEYVKSARRHAEGLKEFIENTNHPERMRLQSLIQGATVDLCQPSDVLKDDGGLEPDKPSTDVPVVAAASFPIDEDEARRKTYYTELMARWDRIKPA